MDGNADNWVKVAALRGRCLRDLRDRRHRPVRRPPTRSPPARSVPRHAGRRIRLERGERGVTPSRPSFVLGPGRRRHRGLAHAGDAGAGGPRGRALADLPADRRRRARRSTSTTCPRCSPGRSGSASTGSTSPTRSSRRWCRCSTSSPRTPRDLGAVNTVVFRDGRHARPQHRLVGLRPRLPRGAARRGRTTGSCWSAPAGPGWRSATACCARAPRTSRCSTRDLERGRRRASNGWPSGSATTGSASPRDLAGRARRRPGRRQRDPGRHARPPRARRVPADLLRRDLWVSDVVYFPLETELVAAARARGCRVLPGGGMAVQQAVGAFEYFTGRPADADADGRALRGADRLMRKGIATVSLSGVLARQAGGGRRRRLRRRSSSSTTTWSRSPLAPARGRRRAAPTSAWRSTCSSRCATSRACRPSAFDAVLHRVRTKLGVMAELGADDPARLLERRSPDAVDDLDLTAEQLHRVGELAAEAGVTVAFEALAWGRHVNRVGQAWEAVRARRPPGGHAGRRHLPHARPRRRRRRAGRRPRRPDRLPPGRRRPAAGHEPARVEPAPPLLPRPGHPRRDRGRRGHAARPATAVRSRSRCSATWCARPTPTSPRGTRCGRWSSSRTSCRASYPSWSGVRHRRPRPSPPAPTPRSSRSPARPATTTVDRAARRRSASRRPGSTAPSRSRWWRNGDAHVVVNEDGRARRAPRVRARPVRTPGRGRRRPGAGAALAGGGHHPRRGRGACCPGITSPSGLHVFVSDTAGTRRPLAGRLRADRCRRRRRRRAASTTSVISVSPLQLNEEMAFFRTVFGFAPGTARGVHGAARPAAQHRAAAGRGRRARRPERRPRPRTRLRTRTASPRWRCGATTWPRRSPACGRAACR